MEPAECCSVCAVMIYVCSFSLENLAIGLALGVLSSVD